MYEFCWVLLHYTDVLRYITGGYCVSSDMAGAPNVRSCEVRHLPAQTGGYSAPHYLVSLYSVMPELRPFADEHSGRQAKFACMDVTARCHCAPYRPYTQLIPPVLRQRKPSRFSIAVIYAAQAPIRPGLHHSMNKVAALMSGFAKRPRKLRYAFLSRPTGRLHS